MTVTASRSRRAAAVAPASPRSFVVGAVVRQVRRGTAVVSVLAAAMPAFVAVQYRDTFDGAVSASSLQALAENPAIRTLFGPPVGLDTVGGFTVWRLGTVLAVLVGTWAALEATRVTRGEEAAGRWDLLLAGRLRLAALVRIHLGVLLVATALPGVATAVGMLLAGTEWQGALLFGVMIGGAGTTGAALGVLASQLLAERRAATGLAVAVLLGGLLARMVGDGVPALAWLHWGSPFGLLGRAEPFAADRWVAVPVLVLLVALPAVAALRAAADRDAGNALLAGAGRSRTPSRLVRSLGGLAVHRVRRPLVGWALALGAYYLLIGLLARSMAEFLRDNRSFADLAAQAGFAQLGSVEGYASALLSLLAVPLGAFAASRVSAGAADERAGRLTPLYSLPVSRVRWAVTESATVAGAVVVLAVVTGTVLWTGTVWVDAGLSLGDAAAGALNVVPVAALCLGAALAALGWAPGAVLGIGVLPAAGGYLLLVFSDTFGWPAWIRSVSPFAHVASVPAEPAAVGGAVGMLAVAAVLAGLGLVGYARRDLLG